MPALDGSALAPAPYRVASRHQETSDTWTLTLDPATPSVATEAFSPGQFAMLYAFGAGEAPISVSDQRERLVHTIRAVGAVTSALCASSEGDVVGVRGPFGNRWPTAHARGQDVVVIAGGIGLAPLRPAIYELLAAREDYGNVSILYGGRTPADLLYVEELEHWRGRFDIDLSVTVDAAAQTWHGPVGVVTELFPRTAFDPARTVAMMCGPEVMMRFAAAGLLERGVPPDAIWVSLERSMKCAVGHCGHCQLGPLLICRDGPVFRHDTVAGLMRVPGL